MLQVQNLVCSLIAIRKLRSQDLQPFEIKSSSKEEIHCYVYRIYDLQSTSGGYVHCCTNEPGEAIEIWSTNFEIGNNYSRAKKITCLSALWGSINAPSHAPIHLCVYLKLLPLYNTVAPLKWCRFDEKLHIEPNAQWGATNHEHVIVTAHGKLREVTNNATNFVGWAHLFLMYLQSAHWSSIPLNHKPGPSPS